MLGRFGEVTASVPPVVARPCSTWWCDSVWPSVAELQQARCPPVSGRTDEQHTTCLRMAEGEAASTRLRTQLVAGALVVGGLLGYFIGRS